MKIIERGHIYELENKHSGVQRIVFFKDLPHSVDGHDGVLTQEVIRAVLDRMLELFAQKPCSETWKIIKKLRECLILFETRAARGTLEKSYAKVGLHIEQLPTKANGHVFDL